MSGDLGRFTSSQGLGGTTSSKVRQTTRVAPVLSYSCNGVMGYGPGCHRKLGSMVSNSMGYWVVATQIFFNLHPENCGR